MLHYMHHEVYSKPQHCHKRQSGQSQAAPPLRLNTIQYKCTKYAHTQFSQNKNTHQVSMQQQYVRCTARALRY